MLGLSRAWHRQAPQHQEELAKDDAASPQLWVGLLELHGKSPKHRSCADALRAAAGRCQQAHVLGVCTASSFELWPAGEAAYLVKGAGAAECNGYYWPAGERDGVMHYVQPKTGVSLLRYRFNPSGRAYWFMSLLDQAGNDRADLDFYSTEASEEALPPSTGWKTKVGKLPAPAVDRCGETLLCALVDRDSAALPIRRCEYDSIQSVWCEGSGPKAHVCISECRSPQRKRAIVLPRVESAGSWSSSEADVEPLRLSVLAADGRGLSALLQRRLLISRQCRWLLDASDSAVAGPHGSCPDTLVSRVLGLDAMFPWLQSLGLGVAAELVAASDSMFQLLSGLWRSVTTKSARAALAVTARHGRSAPIEELCIGHQEGEPYLSLADLKEIVLACPELHSLTVLRQPAAVSLLHRGLHTLPPSLCTLALSCGSGVAQSASHVEMNAALLASSLSAPALLQLRSFTVDATVASRCLEELLEEQSSLHLCLQPVLLLLTSLVNVLQGPSPLGEPSDAERLPWRLLSSMLLMLMFIHRIIRQNSEAEISRDALRDCLSVEAQAVWALAALLARRSTDVLLTDLVSTFCSMLSRMEVEDEAAFSGESLRVASHGMLSLCQTAMLHRTRGVPRQLTLTMIKSGALRTLRSVAARAPGDAVVLQRVLCILDLFSYEAPEGWPLEDISSSQALCRRVLDNLHSELTEDDALVFHAEALFGRWTCKPQEQPQSSWWHASAHWRSQLRPGDQIDAMDAEQAAWYEAFVVEVGAEADKAKGGIIQVKVHFMGWHPRWDAWIDLRTEGFRIQPRHRVVRPWRSRLGPSDCLDVKLPEGCTAQELGYARASERCYSLPFGVESCSSALMADPGSQMRWRSGKVLEIRRSGAELWARVSVDAVESNMLRAGSLLLSRESPDSGISEEGETLKDLLHAGMVLEFWVDLNGDFVQRAGTHTSRQRPVWGVLLPPPKIPHECPEGGPARWVASLPIIPGNGSRSISGLRAL